MVSEVSDLYKSISRYDKSVVTNLKEINAELSQAVTESRNFPFNLQESRSYQLSTAMLGVLNTYNQLVFLTETTLKNLRLKLMQIHRNFPLGKQHFISTHHPEEDSGTYAETLYSSKTFNVGPKKLPPGAIMSLEKEFQNIPKLALKPEVKNKLPSAQFKPQTLKIQYTPTELFRMNPRGQRANPFKSKDTSKWKSVPPSLLKNYKEKHAIYEIRDTFARTNEHLKTVQEDKKKEVSIQVLNKSVCPEDGAINEKTSKNNQMEDLPIPSNGDTISILVTGYKTACHFYAQLYGKSSYQFSELMGQINSSCMLETYTAFEGDPKVGQLLLAKHNGLWYRARCLSREHDQIKVFLVDVGITVMKKMVDIAQMEDDFLRFPFYAMECVLDGVCERRELLPEKSRKFFEKIMLQKRFTALVVESGIPIRLRMYDAKGLDMCYVLEMYGIVSNNFTLQHLKNCES